MSNNRSKLLLLLLVAIAADQLLKYTMLWILTETGSISLLGGTVQFTLIFNPGGFLSVLSDYSQSTRFFLLNICVSMLLLGSLFCIFISTTMDKKFSLPLVLVTAGGISNLIDRMIHEDGVIDFVSIGIGSFRTGIFNLADMYILVCSFYLGYILFTKKQINH
jgi:signal peptidase II